MMKLAPCPIVLLLAVILSPLPAAAAQCGEPAMPKISVRIDAAPAREDRSLSLAELSKIPSASRRAGMEAYDRTLGLTEADIGAKADIDLVTVEDGSGGYCTRARSALITLEWNTVVHIASQIPPGSCIDQVVSAHEQKHVAIDRELIPIARQAIEIALTSVIRHSIPGRTAAESQRNLQDQARATVNQAIDIFTVVRTRKQLALDSKEEYDRVPKSCGIMDYLRVMHGVPSQAGT
jgi:hypothetical protein